MSLYDVDHTWGEDIQVSNTGDLNLVTDTDRGKQRILRRVLTNPGDYVFENDYGGGLLQDIGSITDAEAIESRIQSQVLMEDAVAPTPAPTVAVDSSISGYDASAIELTISYQDQPSNAPTVLAFVATS